VWILWCPLLCRMQRIVVFRQWLRRGRLLLWLLLHHLQPSLWRLVALVQQL